MQYNTRKTKYHSCWLLLLLVVVSCTGKQTKGQKLIADAENGLLQIKNSGRHQIAMEIMSPAPFLQPGGSSVKDFYKVKLLLRSTERINGITAMQYLNFGIKSSFYAVEGADTLHCIICERIPGINDKEYVYMALFKRPTRGNQPLADLRLVVTDTIAGFGITVFDIKNNALKKLDAVEE